MRQASKRIISLITICLLFLTACSVNTMNNSDSSPKTNAATSAASENPSNKKDGDGGNIKIGITAPISGSLAQLGQETIFGAEIAVSMVNEAGGVNGKKVELIKADTPTPDAAKSQTERLITQEGLKIIAGNYGSSLSIATAATAKRYGAFYWEQNSASYEIVKSGLPYVIKTTWGNKDLSEILVKGTKEQFSKQLNMKPEDIKIAFIHEDSGWGTELSGFIKEDFQSAGLKLVASEPYNAANTSDFTPLILRLKKLNPDIVVAASYIKDATLFWRTAKEQNFSPKIMVGLTAGYGIADFAKALGKDADGVYVIDANVDIKADALSPNAKKISDEFNKRFKEKTQHFPASHALYAFIGMHTLLTEVLPKSSSLNKEDILDAAMKLDIPAGDLPMGFGIKFRNDNTIFNHTNTRGMLFVNQWQNGEMKVVYPSQFATAQPLVGK